jgi:transcriptional regulator with XRE-family HTH domain
MGVPNKKIFGQYLFDLRMKYGLTLTELGKKIGISANYVGELERGKKEASDEVVRKIAVVYNTQEETLFAMMGRVPLGIKEETEHSPELQKLLSEIAKNKNLSEDAKKRIYQKVRKYYESLLEDI